MENVSHGTLLQVRYLGKDVVGLLYHSALDAKWDEAIRALKMLGYFPVLLALHLEQLLAFALRHAPQEVVEKLLALVVF